MYTVCHTEKIMASNDIEKLRNLLARRANKFKEIIDNEDLGDLTCVARVLEVSNELNDELMLLLSDMMDKRRLEQERERDRFEDDIGYRDRSRGDSRDSRDYSRRSYRR